MRASRNIVVSNPSGGGGANRLRIGEASLQLLSDPKSVEIVNVLMILTLYVCSVTKFILTHHH